MTRPIVLAGLDAYADTVRVQTSGIISGLASAERRRNRLRTMVLRAALHKAAEDGYLTWSSWAGGPPTHWADWCRVNRHPPVFREIGRTYARVQCWLPGATIPTASVAPIADLMRTFVHRRRGAFAPADKVWAGRVTADERAVIVSGVLIGESATCARLLTDALLECVIWQEKQS